MAEQLNSVADSLLAQLPQSPDVYPQKIDLASMMVLLVQLDAATYRAASFLDDRILGPATKGGWVAVDRVAEGTRRVATPRPLHFILHTGHVGSTLVSRLLDETGVVLSLREPLPLRTFADAYDLLRRVDSLLSRPQFDLALDMLLRLWARGYAGTRSVVVKATSSASRLAAPILTRDGSARAIYMNLRAEPYLATLLAGQNSWIDLRGHAPERIRRLQARVAAPLAPLHALSLGELAAMSWLAESWTQRDLLKQFPERVSALDFDQFLANVEAGMVRVVGHFGLELDPGAVSVVARSPVLTRYSKAPEYAYTPGVRGEVLRESRRGNGEEIRKGIAWLERLARSDPAIAEIVGAV